VRRFEVEMRSRVELLLLLLLLLEASGGTKGELQ